MLFVATYQNEKHFIPPDVTHSSPSIDLVHADCIPTKSVLFSRIQSSRPIMHITISYMNILLNILPGFLVLTRYNIEEDVVSVKPTRPPPSRPGWAAAAASAAAASSGTSNGTYGGYSAPGTGGGGQGYGGFGAQASSTPAAPASSGGYGGYTNGNGAGGAMPAMAAPPLPPKPKPPSEPQAKVLYDYDPAGQEGMVAVSAGQVRRLFPPGFGGRRSGMVS